MGPCDRGTHFFRLTSEDANIWLIPTLKQIASRFRGYAPVGERLVFERCQSWRESDPGLGLICWIAREAVGAVVGVAALSL
jgi:hypothetical protein